LLQTSQQYWCSALCMLCSSFRVPC